MSQDFSREDSLRVIAQMIEQVKQKPRAIDAFNTLLWGYLVLSCALLHWFILHTRYAPQGSWVWLLILVGWVVAIVVNRRFSQQQRATTYVDQLIRYLWQGFGISMGLVLLGLKPDGVHFLPTVMVFYGLAMYVQGGLLRFPPYRWGAFAGWACGGIAYFLNPTDQLLLLALAVLGSYLVPGHVLLYQTRHQHV